jgi:predicted phage baseplate assembly protein
MALIAPNLDDRTFQDIVREARSKIPLYCPKWTDYNLSDPGVTMIELFAWMVDMLLYRLNRVPDKNYIKFMELIGVRLEPPKAAHVDITFRLSAPQPRVITIPAGTEVATVRTETQEAINFITSQDLSVLLPTLTYALTSPDEAKFTDCMPALKNQSASVSVFSQVPQENNALYLGFKEDLNSQTLALTLDANIEGIGVDPHDPPLSWEFWHGELQKWVPARVETDTTGGLNVPGNVILHIPYESRTKEINGLSACWVRCRATRPRTDQRGYTSSPRLRTVVAECVGGTVPATQCFRIWNEMLGRSDGNPGQTFTLHNTPVLTRESRETIEVETERDGYFEPWTEVPDFAGSGPDDRHYTLDSTTGEVQFGPVIRQPSGEERQYGRRPPAGRQIRCTSYRWGGGVVGNVGEKTIVVLKSSVPYIDRVINFRAATGGADAETLDRAKLRAPKVIRARTRAVTTEDFECLALEASSLVSRARCLSPGTADGSPAPGVIRLLLVPAITDTDRLLSASDLEIGRRMREEVQSYLDERRLLGTTVELTTPEYFPIAVVARVKVKDNADITTVVAGIESRLYHYINPVSGGPSGDGWPFGRSISLSEVYAAVQDTPGLDYVDNIVLYPVDPQTGIRQEASPRIAIPRDSLMYSHKHEVAAEKSGG